MRPLSIVSNQCLNLFAVPQAKDENQFIHLKILKKTEDFQILCESFFSQFVKV